MTHKKMTNLTFTIAGRSIPVEIDEHDKELWMQKVTDINEKISFFQQSYPGRDKLDCTILTMLTLLEEQFTLHKINEDKVARRLDEINALIA